MIDCVPFNVYVLCHFRMFAIESFSGIHLVISLFLLCIIICQLISIYSLVISKASSVFTTSLAILNTFLNLILFGLLNSLSVLHLCALTLLLLTGTFQVIVLGLVNYKKRISNISSPV